MKSYIYVTASRIAFLISSIVMIVLTFVGGPLKLLSIPSVVYIATGINHIYSTTCPHCRRLGCGIPFKKKSWHCKRCGELIDYE